MLLSNKDIKRELIKAKNISIHPLREENIKGSSLNLTASKYAWDIHNGSSAVTDDKEKIIIPPNSTVCIFSEEALWVSRRIGGTYHPRVSLTSTGMGHISTTLDPQWYGLSLVPVNNPTLNPIEIRVGGAFVSIMFYYVKTPATKGVIDNQASRPDIYSKFNTSDDEKRYLDEQWHRSRDTIVQSMLESDSYKKLYGKRTKFRKSISNFFEHSLVSAVIGGLVVGGILYILGMN